MTITVAVKSSLSLAETPDYLVPRSQFGVTDSLASGECIYIPLPFQLSENY